MKRKTLISLVSSFIILLFVLGCATSGPVGNKLNLEDKIEIKKQSLNRRPEALLTANMSLTLFDSQGRIKDQRTYHNLVVNAGLAGVASRINGDGSEAVFTYVAIGIGTTAAAAGDTALQSEITTGGGSRAAATVSRITTTVTNDTAKWVITYSFTASFAVTESGILNAASAGTMLARKVFGAINVANTDSLQISWTVQSS